MFVGIANTPRDYAWGSSGAISTLLGTVPSGRPEAELWLGAHPGSPSRLMPSGDSLAAVVDGRLPFLMKVLAAASPLSLQAHPTPALAAAGFERENELGIPIDAPQRNYRDPFAKPELIYALEDGFEALCGFRDPAETVAAIDRLRRAPGGEVAADPLLQWRALLTGGDPIRDALTWLISRGPGVDAVVATISRLAESDPELDVVRRLAGGFPGDPGIAISLMLNHVTLAAGEALYLPAGNIHAYLRGIGIEVMAASDNVLRGGLTPKHVDVPELMAVLDFAPTAVPYLRASRPSAGVEVFRPGVPEFQLIRLAAGARFTVRGPAIALCVGGSAEFVDESSRFELAQSEAVYGDGGSIAVTASGTVFIATTGG